MLNLYFFYVSLVTAASTFYRYCHLSLYISVLNIFSGTNVNILEDRTSRGIFKTKASAKVMTVFGLLFDCYGCQPVLTSYADEFVTSYC